MATTLEIVTAVVERLREKQPALAVEYFPEKPAEYRLNHPKGALLVSYAGSRFGDAADTGFVAQRRTITVTVTVVMRQLNGRGGAVDALDAVREALFCWRPPDCQRLKLVAEGFLGEVAGLWQYTVDCSCEALLVDAAENEDGVLLTVAHHEERNP
ncbi:MAG: Gp37 family protein [Candidatus Accumulibacter sp.]|jgi:hypothetical protein|nr:Gp37 family protein [Accumulibacter sp.]